MKKTIPFAALLALAACSKKEPPAATETAPAASAAEPPVVFDPTMPSFKCGSVRCNIDYYCVERKQQKPSEVCTMHPPGPKREGCTKVATRTYTCETFP